MLLINVFLGIACNCVNSLYKVPFDLFYVLTRYITDLGFFMFFFSRSVAYRVDWFFLEYFLYIIFLYHFNYVVSAAM